MSMGMYRFWIIVLIISSGTAQAQLSSQGAAQLNEVAVHQSVFPLQMDPHIHFLQDNSAALTFEQVLEQDRLGRFSALEEGLSPNFGFSSDAWWVKFQLSNPATEASMLLLRQDYPLIDFLDFWYQDEGGNWMQHQTGDRRMFAQRQIEHRDFLFPITIEAGESATYYLRFESSGPVNIGLKLYSRDVLLSALGKEQLAYGIYFGGFLVLVFYNLFIFIVVKDRAFFYYLLYVVSYGLYMAVHNGLSFQFMWPESPDWGNQSLLFLLGSTLIWGLQFTRKFVDASQFSPKLDIAAFLLQILVLILILLSAFMPYATVIVPMSAATLLVISLIMIMGWVSLLSGYKPARFFILAWTMLLLGVFVYMLKTFGLLPHNVVTHNGFQIGSLIEMVLLSLALASRVSEIQRQSLTDPLTSIANRRMFDERLQHEFERSKRNNGQLSLLVIDIDLFKKFNDQFGHTKGDEALRMVAKRLRHSSRKIDLVCRYGGEEFAMILPDTDKTSAAAIAERIRESIEAENPAGERVTISIGLANVNDQPFNDVTEFFEAADRALYTAKSEGRNRVVNFYAGMEKPTPA